MNLQFAQDYRTFHYTTAYCYSSVTDICNTTTTTTTVGDDERDTLQHVHGIVIRYRIASPL